MDEKLIEFIKDSNEYLEKNRPNLEIVERRLSQYLKEHLFKGSNVMNNVSTQIRIKDGKSLSEKIIRKKVFKFQDIDSVTYIDNLKDLIGVRLVCLLNQEEGDLLQEIKDKFHNESKIKNFYQIHRLEFDKSYLVVNHSDQPEVQKNGKDIYKMECKWIDEEYGVIPIELQLKSLVNMFWGELEHKLIYKNYSYDEEQGFYSDMMHSISRLLENIDSQLSTINTHLNSKSEKEQIMRARGMLANEIYSHLQKKLDNLLINYEVDFRKVYALLPYLMVFRLSYQQVLETLTKSINKLPNFEFNKDDFEFSSNSLVIEREFQHLQILGGAVSELIRSSDVMWRVLFGLYHKIEGNPIIEKSFQDFIDKLYRIPKTIIDEKLPELTAEMDEEFALGVIEPSLIKATENAFIIYGDMDYYIESSKFGIVTTVIENFIHSLVSHYENLHDFSPENPELKELIEEKLKIQILLCINKDAVSVDDLKQIKQQLETNSYWNFELDYVELDKIFEKDKWFDEDIKLIINLLNVRKDRDEAHYD